MKIDAGERQGFRFGKMATRAQKSGTFFMSLEIKPINITYNATCDKTGTA
jgi:hypothetical protein